ncbi:Homocysteine S-methyltransferase [hydrothermal vent metagenome]|uniref:Homocysteine S-methyltransferase n=1 Tax=hydrothermal vent metagenome TaxID=652676 RepID=A0A3B0UZ53_9ZZZZ
MLNPIRPFLDYQNLFILDGGLATELEARGHDLNDALWSARLLLEQPEAIRQVHSDYLWAGADCVISASYQASLPGLQARGLSQKEAAALIQLSVQLAIDAREQFWAIETNRRGRLRPLVAASVGPYGAYLANGAEYTGNYGLDEAELLAWHRSRWQILANSGADLLACETIPSLPEARALRQLLLETQMPAWISFACRDGVHISDGTPLAECVRLLNDVPNLVAVGINCTPPRFVPDLITAVQSATNKLIIVYPNSGERYDSRNKQWLGESNPSEFGTISREWRKLGAMLLGGCCRTTPAHIQQIRDRTRPVIGNL